MVGKVVNGHIREISWGIKVEDVDSALLGLSKHLDISWKKTNPDYERAMSILLGRCKLVNYELAERLMTRAAKSGDAMAQYSIRYKREGSKYNKALQLEFENKGLVFSDTDNRVFLESVVRDRIGTDGNVRTAMLCLYFEFGQSQYRSEIIAFYENELNEALEKGDHWKIKDCASFFRYEYSEDKGLLRKDAQRSAYYSKLEQESYKKLADEGYVDAMSWMARAHFYGEEKTIPLDRAKAIALWEKCYQAGSDGSCQMAAGALSVRSATLRHKDKISARRYKQLAIFWRKRALEKNHPFSGLRKEWILKNLDRESRELEQL